MTTSNRTVPSISDNVIMAKFLLHGLLGNVLAVVGLSGNTVSIVVLCHRRMRSPSSFYLTSLAVYDNLIQLSMLLFFNLPALGTKMPTILHISDYLLLLIPGIHPLSLAAQMGSIYTCAAFTTERYVAVCWPLHDSRVRRKSRARNVIAAILLWCLAYNVPRYFQYKYVQVWNNSALVYDGELRTTAFGGNIIYRHTYLIRLQLLFMFLIPFIVVLVLNTQLMRTINISRRHRRGAMLSAWNRKEDSVTESLVAVTAVFLVCQFPAIVDNILVAIVGEDEHMTILAYHVIYIVSTSLVSINSSSNFVLFCLFGERLRLVLYNLLGYRRRLKHQPSQGAEFQKTDVNCQSQCDGLMSNVSQVSNSCNVQETTM